jgi:hypothetical protein
MSKPYDRHADSKPEDDAILAIRLLAEKAGLGVVIIGNGDFDEMIEHTRSSRIKFTQQECDTFKKTVASALAGCWMDEAEWAFNNILDTKKTK